MKLTFNISCILIIAVLIFSCSSSNVTKYYKSFYIGPNEAQYFVKPLEFSNDADEELKIDFTFRAYSDSISPVTANHTFTTSQAIGSIDSIVIIHEEYSVSSDSTHRLFIEQDGSDFVIRSSSFIEYNAFRLLLMHDNSTVQLFHTKGKSEFDLTGQLTNKRRLLFDRFIQVIELD